MSSDYQCAKNEGILEIRRMRDRIPHHPLSLRIMKFLFDHDFNEYGDFFHWQFGGSSDSNGEVLMYELDSFFELVAKKEKKTGMYLICNDPSK